MLRASALALAGALLMATPLAWSYAGAPVGHEPARTTGEGRPAAAVPAPGGTPSPAWPVETSGPGDARDGPLLAGPPEVSPRWVWPLTPRPQVVRPFDGPPQPWLAGHRGVDLLAAAGAQVRASADGVVTFRGLVAGRPVLSIGHAGGLRSTYEPVTSTLVAGDVVARGQIIGRLAAGHDCPAPACLHWGARRGETYLDPARLVRADPPVLLPLR